MVPIDLIAALRDVVTELDRELKARGHIFPGAVRSGSLTQRQADHRTKALQQGRNVITNLLDQLTATPECTVLTVSVPKLRLAVLSAS
jgi:hypothetical protein